MDDDLNKRVNRVVKALKETVLSGPPSWAQVPVNPFGAEAIEIITALLARLKAVEKERDDAIRDRDDWRSDYKALSNAIVGDTGLSAMVVAIQARLYKPRAEKAEAALIAADELAQDAMRMCIEGHPVSAYNLALMIRKATEAAPAEILAQIEERGE